MTQCRLSWDSYKRNICNGFSQLQQREEFVDMTLAAEGHLVKVHKNLVALASPYIKDMIQSAPCKHPVIFLNKISHEVLSYLLEYIYTGEIQLPLEKLSSFIEAAKALHISGIEKVSPPELTGTTSKDMCDKAQLSYRSGYSGTSNTLKYFENENSIQDTATKDKELDGSGSDIQEIVPEDNSTTSQVQQFQSNNYTFPVEVHNNVNNVKESIISIVSENDNHYAETDASNLDVTMQELSTNDPNLALNNNFTVLSLVSGMNNDPNLVLNNNLMVPSLVSEMDNYPNLALNNNFTVPALVREMDNDPNLVLNNNFTVPSLVREMDNDPNLALNKNFTVPSLVSEMDNHNAGPSNLEVTTQEMTTNNPNLPLNNSFGVPSSTQNYFNTEIEKSMQPIFLSDTNVINLPLNNDSVAPTSMQNYNLDIQVSNDDKQTLTNYPKITINVGKIMPLEPITDQNQSKPSFVSGFEGRGISPLYTMSTRGSLQLILNRYMYYMHHSSLGGIKRRWRCIDYRRQHCKAIVDTKGEIVLRRNHTHCHPFHDNKIGRKCMRGNVMFSSIAEVLNLDKQKDDCNIVTTNSDTNNVDYDDLIASITDRQVVDRDVIGVNFDEQNTGNTDKQNAEESENQVIKFKSKRLAAKYKVTK